MYAPINNGSYNGNAIQPYNYFPFDINMAPSLLFRSQQHELPDSTGHFSTGNGPLDFSGVSNPSVHTSMESINEDTIVSSQSSPEYISPSEYQPTRSYYMHTEESVPPSNWNTQPIVPCEQNELDSGLSDKNDLTTLSVTNKLNKNKLHQKIKTETKHELIGMII